MKNIDEVIDTVFSLYEQFGSEDYIGERVSQLEHMSQAAGLAMQEGREDEVVLAAFFHDIGHICVQLNHKNDMQGYGVVNHELEGGAFLRRCGFPERVAILVESHVQAKRYLAFADHLYNEALSDASRKTLAFQGGPMTIEEAHGFERQPYFHDSIALRKWDEAAKEEGLPVSNIDEIKRVARRVLEGELS
jgi:2-amino-1-hydroxyethylphosphonate dioxygenase (glycine-forming)